jgi:urease accessory protein
VNPQPPVSGLPFESLAIPWHDVRDLAALLKLQQFADSALPIGGAAHSFGLESLADSNLLDIGNLEDFLSGYLEETGTLDAACCAASCDLAQRGALEEWRRLNVKFGARRPARESREASAAMGRRFLSLAARVSGIPLLDAAVGCAIETHLATSFGFVAGAIGLDPEIAAAAYLQQSITALISACQRLLPLGQTQAQQILWNLKPDIERAAQSRSMNSFTPLLDIASSRHPNQTTRLFMS